MDFRKWLVTAIVLASGGALAAAVPAASSQSAGSAEPREPNVVLLVLDDATVADVRQMPNVRRFLADEGVTFTRNYTPFPNCCPARASILTGLYPHNHHVLDINPPYGGFDRFDDRHTIATYLDPRYRTGIVGKYLNGFDELSAVSPGWDEFQVPVRGTYDYLAQTQKNADGSFSRVTGYMPLVHAGQLMRFIDGSGPTEPYFAYLGWVAPHQGNPADRDGEPASPYVSREFRGRYDGPRLPTSGAFDERKIGDKRRAMRERPRLTRRVVRDIAYTRAQRRESLMAVDRKVAQIVDAVRDRGELDNTYLILTSDNGFMEGQHRIPSGKMQPYEESAAVPLIIRGPGFPAGTKYGGVTGLQDLVPTILSVTHTALPPGAPEPDGVDLAGLVSGSIKTERPQVVEIAYNSRVRNERTTLDPPWLARAVVTADGWKYVAFPQTNEVEMYNLDKDPDELSNLARGTLHASRERKLRLLLEQYRDCAGAACRS